MNIIRHLLNLLLWILPPSRLFSFRRRCLLWSQIDIGLNTSVCGRGWVYGRGVLRVGSNTWLSPGVIFYTHIDAPIVLGSNCDIGPGVEFIPGSHEIGNSSRRAGCGTAKPITVGNGS
jgi:maltose O-acetyltransferase